MYIYIYIFVFLLLCSIFDFCKSGQKNKGLIFILALFVLFIGFRGESGTDSPNYISYFKYNTDSLWNWKNKEPKYIEYGFYYISVLLKSIYNNINFYFLSISAITIFYLYRSLKYFSIYPILGFCVYYSRFLILRDMNQIRQALAIVIIIFFLKYLVKNKRFLFILGIAFASLMHYSILIILPFAFLYKQRYSFIQTIILLLLCAGFGLMSDIVLKQYFITNANLKLLTYIIQDNLGLKNPILYYQLFLFILYFKYESILKTHRGYYIIRNAYFYSLVILLLTCSLGNIGGRLGTIFATCEIFIIPSLCKVIKPNIIGYFLAIILTSLLFYINYIRIAEEPENWIYF